MIHVLKLFSPITVTITNKLTGSQWARHNIIMTEFENGIIKPLITTGTIAFYKRYVDDTIVLAKPCDLHIISKQFNSFHPQIQFTIDQFSDNDIQILPSGTTVYCKQTHTGQYQHFYSYTPWSRKIAWIRALIHRAHKICSNNDLLQKKIHTVKCFMSWNGYSRRLATKLSPYSLLHPLLKIPTLWI